LPGHKRIQVLLNRFAVYSRAASEHDALKDLVSSTFNYLSETPVTQMGLNFTGKVRIAQHRWKVFGQNLAPQERWREALGYIDKLDKNKQDGFGLREITMQLPRPDDLNGFVHVKIAADFQTGENLLNVSINNHIELGNTGAFNVSAILERHWDASLAFAREIISTVIPAEIKD